MKNKCFDIGIIQAFIDGELASDLSEKVIKHIALCDGCATLLAETEEENTFAFSVLDEELNCLVPTERLRTKVFDSIREIERKEKVSWWQQITGSLGFSEGFSFRSPSLVAFASVILFVGMLAVVVKFYEPMPDRDAVASLDSSTVDISKVQKIEVPEISDTSNDSNSQNPVVPTQVSENEDSGRTQNESRKLRRQNSQTKFRAVKTVYTPQKTVIPKKRKQPGVNRNTAPALAEEGGYLQTIATLKKTVDMNKDITLRPSERVAFERDMAVVNDAIKKMKQEVRKDPKNQAAKEVLRASYKNKIDLLNSVAEKTELMASIQ